MSEIVTLSTLGGTESAALRLNDAGTVVGWSKTANGQIHACRWVNGVAQDLGTLGGTRSRARWTNNANAIVGESLLAGGSSDTDFKAFYYDGGVMNALPTLGDNWSAAYAIGDNGNIVGLSANASQKERAVRWNIGAITNLGPLTQQPRSRA